MKLIFPLLTKPHRATLPLLLLSHEKCPPSPFTPFLWLFISFVAVCDFGVAKIKEEIRESFGKEKVLR